MTEDRQRYACTGCGREELLAVSPTDGPVYLRKGCPECGRIVRHYAVGRTGPRGPV